MVKLGRSNKSPRCAECGKLGHTRSCKTGKTEADQKRQAMAQRTGKNIAELTKRKRKSKRKKK